MNDILMVAWLLTTIACAMFVVVMWKAEQLAKRNKHPLVRKAINTLGVGVLGIVGILMAMLVKINGG